MTEPPLHVLLVEDNADDALLLRRMLATAGSAAWQVHHVPSLQDALEALAAQPFDMVLLDLSLPDSQGLQTFQALDRRAPAVPVVVLSGLDDLAVSTAAVQSGAQDYLVKGHFDADLLRRAIRYARERQRLRDSLARQNADLARAREQAERESSFKSRFLSNLSHELRTPLNAIIGFSELLMDGTAGPLTGTQRQYLEHVLSAARHQLALISEILDLSKIEAGRMELRRAWTSLAAVARDVLGVVQPLADRRGVRLEVQLGANLPDLFIDPVRINQVLFNLLSNGIKFTPEGGRVSLQAHARGAHVEIAVEDTGMGIRPEDMPRLFREFEQLDPGPGARREGTGLGLALTRRLVELHGGTVAVSSQPSEGSCFTVLLPLPRRPEDDVAPKP